MNKQNFIWNSIAGLINAAEAVVMSMIVTRVTNLADAGILTIAFAVGNLLICVGKFGVRNFQVTDTQNEYDYPIYMGERMITTAVMIIFAFIYMIYKHIYAGDSLYKVGSVGAICVIYAIESIEDVFWGEYQRRRRLDIGAKLFIVRWSAILVSFLVVLLISHNLLITLWICVLISLIVFIVASLLSEYIFNKDSGDYIWKSIDSDRMRETDNVTVDTSACTINLWHARFDFSRLRTLSVSVFPLFVVAFLAFYINNSAKYALDAVVSSEVQACYGFVAMPVFVIGLLNSMIFQPSVVWLAEQWNSGNIYLFKRKVLRQCGIILLISGVCVVGAAAIGIPVLSILYNTDLTDYWLELVVLQVAGMFLAVEGYFSVVLTIMREQRGLMYGYIGLAIVALFGMRYAAGAHGTLGVAVMYLICMAVLCIVYAVFYYKRIYDRD